MRIGSKALNFVSIGYYSLRNGGEKDSNPLRTKTKDAPLATSFKTRSTRQIKYTRLYNLEILMMMGIK